MKQPLLLKLLDVCDSLDVHYRGHQHLVGLFFGHFKREYRTCVRAVRAALCDLNILDVPAVLLYDVNYNTKILRLAVLNENVKGARGVEYRIFKLDECEFYNKYDERRDHRALEKSRTAAKSDDRRRPESCRGGESLDLTALGDDDSSRADKADARDDLRAETCRVGVSTEVEREVLACQRGHSRAKTDKYMCTEACRAALALTLKSYKSAAEYREHESDGDRQPAYLARAQKI